MLGALRSALQTELCLNNIMCHGAKLSSRSEARDAASSTTAPAVVMCSLRGPHWCTQAAPASTHWAKLSWRARGRRRACWRVFEGAARLRKRISRCRGRRRLRRAGRRRRRANAASSLWSAGSGSEHSALRRHLGCFVVGAHRCDGLRSAATVGLERLDAPRRAARAAAACGDRDSQPRAAARRPLSAPG